MRKKITVTGITLLSLFLLAGCVAKSYISPPPSPESSSSTSTNVIKNYTIGQKQTAYIGNPIIRIKVEKITKYITKIKTMVPSDDFTVTGGFERINISGKKDNHFDVIGYSTIDNVAYTVIKPSLQTGVKKLLIAPDGSVFNKVINKSVVMGYTFETTPKGLKFKISNRERLSDTHQGVGGELNSELIYSGTDHETIKLTYREYTGKDMARSAFNQNLVYEKDKKQIRFKDYVLKLQEVTNEKIVYTVISDGLPK